MGEADLLQQLDAVAATDPNRRRRPFADTVEGQDRRLLERGRKVRAGGVRLVVAGVDDSSPVATAQAAADLAGDVELLAEPHGQGLSKAREPSRRMGDVGLDEPLELGQRLLVESHVIELLRLDPRFVEAVADRVLGEPRIVFLAREALFLDRGDDLAVTHKGGCRVVVERAEAKDGAHVVRPPRAGQGAHRVGSRPQRSRLEEPRRRISTNACSCRREQACARRKNLRIAFCRTSMQGRAPRDQPPNGRGTRRQGGATR